MSVSGICEECDEPITEDDVFETTVKEDHFPNEPHIPSERVPRTTYQCPECGHCPIDNE